MSILAAARLSGSCYKNVWYTAPVHLLRRCVLPSYRAPCIQHKSILVEPPCALACARLGDLLFGVGGLGNVLSDGFVGPWALLC